MGCRGATLLECLLFVSLVMSVGCPSQVVVHVFGLTACKPTLHCRRSEDPTCAYRQLLQMSPSSHTYTATKFSLPGRRESHFQTPRNKPQPLAKSLSAGRQSHPTLVAAIPSATDTWPLASLNSYTWNDSAQYWCTIQISQPPGSPPPPTTGCCCHCRCVPALLLLVAAPVTKTQWLLPSLVFGSTCRSSPCVHECVFMWQHING